MVQNSGPTLATTKTSVRVWRSVSVSLGYDACLGVGGHHRMSSMAAAKVCMQMGAFRQRTDAGGPFPRLNVKNVCSISYIDWKTVTTGRHVPGPMDTDQGPVVDDIHRGTKRGLSVHIVMI